MSERAAGEAKYFAFLSYSHADEKTAARLSRYLETFRVPIRLGGPEQRLPKRMRPIFRDRAEFSASPDLGAAIREALARSQALIVLCSPSAARSPWVNEEIASFRGLGKGARIFAVLVEGSPNESFPPALLEGGIEPLATDFRPAARDLRDARLRLVAALLGIDFDALKRRERIRLRTLRLQAATAGLIVAAVIALGIGFGLVNARDAHRQRNVALALTYASRIRELTAPSVGPESSVTVDANGIVWVTETATPRIARVTPEGTVSEMHIAGADGFGGIAAGPGGTLWLSDSINESIDRVAPDGTLTKFTTGEYIPGSVALAPDGAIWFTESSRNAIGRLRVHSGITEFPIPTRDSNPGGVAIAPNGTVWFTEKNGHSIGRITKAGKLTEVPVPGGASAVGITVGPDRAMWFTQADDKIGRIAADGTISELQTPTRESGLAGIGIGPDGALWFTEGGANKIARIAPDREIVEISLPTPISKPKDVVAGPNGTLWFTEPGIGMIGVLQVTPQRAVTIEMFCSSSDCGAGGMGLDLTRPQDVRYARAYKHCLETTQTDNQVDLSLRCAAKAGIAKITSPEGYAGPVVYIDSGKPGRRNAGPR